jgi:hypothetical protein
MLGFYIILANAYSTKYREEVDRISVMVSNRKLSFGVVSVIVIFTDGHHSASQQATVV